MRFINGLAGCKKGNGAQEIESDDKASVRVVDCVDGFVALRIGTHPDSARLTAEEARHLSLLLTEAAERADARSP